MKKRFVAKQILRLLLQRRHPSLGEIIRSLRLGEGTAVHQRITDLRNRYGGRKAIPCYRDTEGVYRYFIAPEHIERIRKEAA